MYLRDVLPHAHPRFVGGWAETLTSSGLLDSVWKSANSMGHNKRKIKVKEGQKLYNKLYNEMKLLQRGWAEYYFGGVRVGSRTLSGGFAVLLSKLVNKSLMCNHFAEFAKFVCRFWFSEYS